MVVITILTSNARVVIRNYEGLTQWRHTVISLTSHSRVIIKSSVGANMAAALQMGLVCNSRLIIEAYTRANMVTTYLSYLQFTRNYQTSVGANMATVIKSYLQFTRIYHRSQYGDDLQLAVLPTRYSQFRFYAGVSPGIQEPKWHLFSKN